MPLGAPHWCPGSKAPRELTRQIRNHLLLLDSTRLDIRIKSQTHDCNGKAEPKEPQYNFEEFTDFHGLGGTWSKLAVPAGMPSRTKQLPMRKVETLCDLYETLTITQAIIYCNTRRKVGLLVFTLRQKRFQIRPVVGKKAWIDSRLP